MWIEGHCSHPHIVPGAVAEEEEGLTFSLSRAVTRKGFAGMCRECDPVSSRAAANLELPEMSFRPQFGVLGRISRGGGVSQ